MARNGRSSLARTRSWLEMAARAWLRAAAGSRNGCSSLARSHSWLAMAAGAWHGAAAGSRNGRSSLAQRRSWLEMAARASPLGHSTWLLDPPRLRWGTRNGSSNSLELARLRQGARNCLAWLLENIAPADVSEFEPARIHWGAPHWRSSPLGSAGPETLHWAGPRMPAALNTETNFLVHGMHGFTFVYVGYVSSVRQRVHFCVLGAGVFEVCRTGPPLADRLRDHTDRPRDHLCLMQGWESEC